MTTATTPAACSESQLSVEEPIPGVAGGSRGVGLEIARSSPSAGANFIGVRYDMTNCKSDVRPGVDGGWLAR